MSTLKVAAINNPSASSGGLAISASGNVTGAGLDLITTQSFSAVSSVSINNCFSGDYDNYRVLVQCVAAAGAVMRLRMRAAGSDLSGSHYSYGTGGWDSAGGSASYGGGSQTSFGFTYVSTLRFSLGLDVLSPQLTQFTQVVGSNQGINAADTAYVGASFGGVYFQTTAVDGFTIYPASSNISGTVSVYGYKK